MHELSYRSAEYGEIRHTRHFVGGFSTFVSGNEEI